MVESDSEIIIDKENNAQKLRKEITDEHREKMLSHFEGKEKEPLTQAEQEIVKSIKDRTYTQKDYILTKINGMKSLARMTSDEQRQKLAEMVTDPMISLVSILQGLESFQEHGQILPKDYIMLRLQLHKACYGEKLKVDMNIKGNVNLQFSGFSTNNYTEGIMKAIKKNSGEIVDAQYDLKEEKTENANVPTS